MAARWPARLAPIALAGALAALAGCGDVARLTVEQTSGPNPQIQAPRSSVLPTVQVAKAEGWQDGRRPTPAAGYSVQAFASGLQHPRWLHVLPNGDVLVAESAAPQLPPDAGKAEREKGADGGPRGWVMGLLMKRAGSRVPSADRITLLRDADRDGVAETRTVLIDGLRSPFGMALIGQQLYIANTDAVVRVPFQVGQTRIAERPVTVVALPGWPKNHHWTKNLIADADGRRLYITVGSNSNVAEDGLEIERDRAAIHELDLATGTMRPFATGLRNPNGMAWVPGERPALWTVVNERDEIGSDLVPDYLTEVRDGAFYGWPWSYWGQHVDRRVQPQRSDLVAAARVPDYGLGAHTASLGLAWVGAGQLQPTLGTGMVIGQHGSWNRKPPSGYRVVFVPFANGKPEGAPRTLLSGFLSPDGDTAWGRPVGVATDGQQGLLVADDVGNTVWRLRADPVPAQALVQPPATAAR